MRNTRKSYRISYSSDPITYSYLQDQKTWREGMVNHSKQKYPQIPYGHKKKNTLIVYDVQEKNKQIKTKIKRGDRERRSIFFLYTKKQRKKSCSLGGNILD